MRFLDDNALSPRMVDGLRSLGHGAIHVQLLGLAAADDSDVLTAAADARILISEDSFGTLLAAHNANYPSVIIFRCRNKSVNALLPLLVSNLERITNDLDAGAVAVFEDTRIRLRRLPLCEK